MQSVGLIDWQFHVDCNVTLSEGKSARVVLNRRLVGFCGLSLLEAFSELFADGLLILNLSADQADSAGGQRSDAFVS